MLARLQCRRLPACGAPLSVPGLAPGCVTYRSSGAATHGGPGDAPSVRHTHVRATGVALGYRVWIVEVSSTQISSTHRRARMGLRRVCSGRRDDRRRGPYGGAPQRCDRCWCSGARKVGLRSLSALILTTRLLREHTLDCETDFCLLGDETVASNVAVGSGSFGPVDGGPYDGVGARLIDRIGAGEVRRPDDRAGGVTGRSRSVRPATNRRAGTRAHPPPGVPGT